MTDEEYMKIAIEVAIESEKNGGIPVGAIIVKDNKVIARGTSAVWPDKDPSAHGEIMSIREACKNLQDVTLTNCTMYTVLESCSMCMGCAGWAGLSKIVFGAFKEDAEGNPYELDNYHAIEHAKRIKLFGGGKLEIKGGILREECKKLLKNYHNWIKVK